MFDDMLLHEGTAKRLKAFIGRPGHGLLIAGPAGSGKKYLANRLSAVLLNSRITKLDNHPNFILVCRPEDKSEIPIDSARQLISRLNLKVPGSGRLINRIAVIQDAELLSHEAQNALLKLLEEPPAGSLLILTSSWPQNILPTVVSRLQKLTVQPVALKQATVFFKGFSSSEIESAWQLSRGAPGLLAALLAEGPDHQMKQAVQEAKQVLSHRNYQRLSSIQAAAKDKAHFELMLDALSKVLSALHQANITNPALAKKILAARQIVLSTQDSLQKNANLRLAALNLSLNIPL